MYTHIAKTISIIFNPLVISPYVFYILIFNDHNISNNLFFLIAVFFSSPVRNRSNDVDFEYHQDPNMYYLSGYEEPHGVLIISKNEINILLT